ncbi:MAG: hypothetical protein OEL76_14420 [Siculibacillus sp.]|nr:hypothetical protein [Siculibacillus sp.]
MPEEERFEPKPDIPIPLGGSAATPYPAEPYTGGGRIRNIVESHESPPPTLAFSAREIAREAGEEREAEKPLESRGLPPAFEHRPVASGGFADPLVGLERETSVEFSGGCSKSDTLSVG